MFQCGFLKICFFFYSYAKVVIAMRTYCKSGFTSQPEREKAFFFFFLTEGTLNPDMNM